MLVPDDINKEFPTSPSSPWSYEGTGKLACILVHGFTGVPFEMRPIGKMLMEHSISHSSILLPGHGETVEIMADSTWMDWYNAAKNETLKLREKYNKVVAIGFSMGGTLALNLAVENLVDGVVSLAGVAKFVDKRMFLAKYVSKYKVVRKRKPQKAPYMYLVEDKYLGYANHPYAGIYQLYLLIKYMRKQLFKVEVPSLLIHSKNDQVVPFENMNYIAKHLDSGLGKTVSLTKSNHVITWDVESDIVNEEIIEFLNNFK